MARVLLTYNDDNAVADALTRVFHRMNCSVHHVRLTGHQPVLQDPGYQRRVAARLLRTIDEASIDVFVPVFEEVFFLAKCRNRIRCRTLMPDAETCRKLHHKRSAARFNARHGLPHIPTLIPSAGVSRRDIETFIGRYGDPNVPVFLKEDNSRGGYGSKAFASISRLWKYLSQRDPVHYVIQPFVSGSIWVIQGMFVDGQLVDYEILRKRSLWNDRGAVKFVPYHCVGQSSHALGLLRTIGELTHFQGMLEFECMGVSGDLKILEYNPRFSGDFPHTVLTGSSFAENTARAYIGLKPIPHLAKNGMTRLEGIGRRYLRRQLGSRPAALLNVSWCARWAAREAGMIRIRMRSPYRSYSARPDSIELVGS